MPYLNNISLLILTLILSACGAGGVAPASISTSASEAAGVTPTAASTLPPDTALPDEALSESDAALTDAPPPGSEKLAPGIFQSHFDLSLSEESKILAKYAYLDPERLVNSQMLKRAVIFFNQNQERIKNRFYLTIVDYSLSSISPRFFVINMMTGKVWSMHVAQGKGSDVNGDGLLERFSNAKGSNATARGFYFTAETFTGSHGLSLRLDGVSPTNYLARQRAIILHSADYVVEAEVIQGRSWGCLAIASQNSARLITLIKGGSVIYVDG